MSVPAPQSPDASVHGHCLVQDILIDVRTGADGKDVELSTSPTEPQTSIYDRYSSRQHNLMLFAISLTRLLAPFADTMYLPSLSLIQSDLQGTDVQAAATLATFLIAVAVSGLLWGPTCDFLGRRPTYIISGVGFLGASLGCAFAPTMWVLLLLRTVQGLTIGAYTVVASGVITDVYPLGKRGVPFGVTTMFQLSGRTLGGLLGGFVSQRFGWRSSFLAVAVLTGAVVLPCLLCFVPETHRYKVVQKLRAVDPTAAAQLAEASDILSKPPRFNAPWAPLLCIAERRAVLHVCVSSIGVAATYLTMILASSLLPAAPYFLSTSMIGVVHFVGVVGVFAALLGGFMFDKAIALHATEPMARLTYTNVVVLLTIPTGMLLFGWSMFAKAHLAVIVVAMGFVCAGAYLYQPALISYLSVTHPHAPSTAAAGVFFLQFSSAGVFVVTGVAAARAIGVFNLCIGLAVLQLVITLAAAGQIILRCKHATLQNLPERSV